MKKICKTCRFWDPASEECEALESEYFADNTEPGHTCPDWEGKEGDDG